MTFGFFEIFPSSEGQPTKEFYNVGNIIYHIVTSTAGENTLFPREKATRRPLVACGRFLTKLK